MRRIHRILGPILALPLILWMVTGLLFHIKHRYTEAYEVLAVPRASADWAQARMSPGDVIGRGLAAAPLVLEMHPTGRIAYFGKQGNRPVAIDATTGEILIEASVETARLWVASALAKSSNRQRYGSELSAQVTSMVSARTGTKNPALAMEFSGGKNVQVDLITGEITQTGALNQFIDATYRLHYLQWTPWNAVNIALVLCSIPLILFLALTGLRMALARGKV